MLTMSFYAHRGGTGRTLCAVNCAAELARQGKRVLLVDLDIDAGGMNIVLKGELLEIQHEKPEGLSAYFANNGQLKIEDAAEDLKTYEKFKRINGILSAILIYVNPFQQDMQQLHNATPTQFVRLIKKLKQDIDSDTDYDFLIFDLPTGSNDINTQCFFLSDLVILLSRPNTQGAYGTGMIKDLLLSEGIPAICVLSSVPNIRTVTTRDKLARFQEMAGLVDPRIEVLPFDNSLAFFEDIPVLERPRSAIAKAYRKLVDRITEGR